MKLMKWIGVFALMTIFSQHVHAVAAETVDEVKVAVVNGSVITQHDLDVQFKSYAGEIAAKSRRALSEKELDRLRGDVLERMIDQRLLFQAAVRKNVSIDEAAYQKEIEELDTQIRENPEFKAEIEKTEYTMDQIHGQIRQNMMVNRFLRQTFFDPLTVTDDTAKAYYDQNPKRFESPEKVRARHILIKPEGQDNAETRAAALEKIKKIEKKLADGEKFEALAKEYSHCPSSKEGGDLNYFTRGQMVPPFEKAAFALAVNQISDVVETRFGYHLIQLTDKVPGQTIAFDDVKEDLKQTLKYEKAMDKVQAFLQDAKKTGSIELFLN